MQYYSANTCVLGHVCFLTFSIAALELIEIYCHMYRTTHNSSGDDAYFCKVHPSHHALLSLRISLHNAYLKVVALCVLLDAIVIGELQHKMVVFGSIADHRLAPLAVIGAADSHKQWL